MVTVDPNERCPCGSQVAYMHCHGAPLSDADQAVRHAQAAELREIQRARQQGAGRPIVSSLEGENRRVVVGRSQWIGPWATFTDFLGGYLRQRLGKDWGLEEMAKPSHAQHPIIAWHLELGRLESLCYEPGREIQSMPLTGAAMAYLGLAYDLYTLEHNESSTPSDRAWNKLLQRLRHPREFFGVRYELRAAGWMIRAGYRIEWEERADAKRGEFNAWYAPNGAAYSVECKIRQPSPANQDRNVGGFTSLVRNALSKESEHRRLVFVDLNKREHKRFDPAQSSFRDYAINQLRKLEVDPNWRDLPPALIVITNIPDHLHLDTFVPDAGAVLEGFKTKTYRADAKLTLKEAVERRKEQQDTYAILNSIGEYSVPPSSFDGSILGVDDNPSRLRIGSLYEFSGSCIGCLEEAVLDETEGAAHAIVSTADGTRSIVRIPLTVWETEAWKLYPETFLGVRGFPRHQTDNGLGLFDFMLDTVRVLGREQLIKQLEEHHDRTSLEGCSQKELAEMRAIVLAESLLQRSGGFPTREWLERLRQPRDP